MSEKSLLGKVPPRSFDSERAVLASLLLDTSVINEIYLILESKDFYLETHQIIYSAIVSLHSAKKPVDVVTVNEYLRANKLQDKIGGADYLSELLHNTPTISNTQYYSKVVKELSQKRQIRNACLSVIDSIQDEDRTIDEILDTISLELINPIYKERTLFKTIHINDAIPSTLDFIEKMYHEKDDIRGIPSGLIDIDRITSGFQKSDLITLAARPGIGKTTFAMNVALHAAKNDFKVLFISLEMSITQLMLKLFSIDTHIDQFKLKNGKISGYDFMNLSQHSIKLGKYPFWINDTPNLKMGQVKAIARQQKYSSGIDLMILDYIGIIDEDTAMSKRTRAEAVGNMSKGLKQLAKELDIPIMMIAQLNREIEKRSNPHPILSDLKESGNIEQDSDIVMFLYSLNNQYDENQDNTQTEMIKCDISKHRNGTPAFGIDLYFNKSILKFENAVRGQNEI